MASVQQSKEPGDVHCVWLLDVQFRQDFARGEQKGQIAKGVPKRRTMRDPVVGQRVRDAMAGLYFIVGLLPFNAVYSL